MHARTGLHDRSDDNALTIINCEGIMRQDAAFSRVMMANHYEALTHD